tara:strand:- start:1294 stop:1956 length:663 start_codon:yes stop_codon:yes gene_type:complete
MLTTSEENYLKTIYNLSESGKKQVSTNSISKFLKTKPSSVTDMIKKLSAKKLLYHKKYKGTNISSNGKKLAIQIIRKHRLWEVFLFEKLNFKWDEVHKIAEELEHITNEKLIERLDKYLKYPKIDPHGDPIPNKNGEINIKPKIKLSNLLINNNCIVSNVNDDDGNLLEYLNKIKIHIGSKIKVFDIIEFDKSIEIEIDSKNKVFISNRVAENILVTKTN